MVGIVNGLQAMPHIVNRILKAKFYLKTRNGDGILNLNAMRHIMEGVPFDVTILILNEIDDHIYSLVDNICYAPHIMCWINKKV